MVLRYSAKTLSFISWHEMQNCSRLVYSSAVLKPPQKTTPAAKPIATTPKVGVLMKAHTLPHRPLGFACLSSFILCLIVSSSSRPIRRAPRSRLRRSAGAAPLRGRPQAAGRSLIACSRTRCSVALSSQPIRRAPRSRLCRSAGAAPLRGRPQAVGGGPSLHAAGALEGVVHQRLGIGLGHVALGAEVAARAEVVQLLAVAGLEVGHAHPSGAAGLGLGEGVAVHALVVVLGNLVG